MESNTELQPNYDEEYDAHWSRDDRIGEPSRDLEQTADQIIATCGIGSVLIIGSGEGGLVSALLRRGVDARGLDFSEIVVLRCNQRIAGRFTHGAVLSLPFHEGEFDTVVSTDSMAHLAPEDIPQALREIHRVSKRYVFLKIATTQDRDQPGHFTFEGRAWWETRCFMAGFRKHPAYYKLNDYESLNRDGWQIGILLEKIPKDALVRYSLESLNDERGLHMDMTRDTGARSDAHIIRYQWASDYIKPGDRVLDAACGLGYGSHVIGHLTEAEKIVGIDGSEYAVDYATRSFGAGGDRITFRQGLLPEALSEYEDGAFDVIVSFETLEHVEAPQALLRAFNRLLTPGGRVIVSVPNDWSDESGEDPNPYHLHVYTWERLRCEISKDFIPEHAFAQTATQCKSAVDRYKWRQRPRTLQRVAITDSAPEECEWWLMVGMKSPLGAGHTYEERVFRNIAHSGHPSICYSSSFQNPWLMHSMVNVGYRQKNDAELEALALEVIAATPKTSNDHAAAVCVQAYRILGRRCSNASDLMQAVSQISDVVDVLQSNAMGLRWKVSLLFVKAKLLQAAGDLLAAKSAFIECGSFDVRGFGVHLATKPTQAWYEAGKLANALGEPEEARRCWSQGVEYGTVLLSVSIDDVLINKSFPNRFNHGDGVREYAAAWDNISRCANGLNLLARGGKLEYRALDNCFQTEYLGVTNDLLDCRRQLVERTEDLVITRQALSDRTAMLEQTSKDLTERTEELVATRQVLSDRTAMLEQTSKDLTERTEELVATRQVLSDRTAMLEQTSRDLSERTGELVATRQVLSDRTAMLEQTSRDLSERTGELVVIRQVLSDRTAMLEQASRDLIERTEELVASRQGLSERTRELTEAKQAAAVQAMQLRAASDELNRLKKSIAYRLFYWGKK